MRRRRRRRQTRRRRRKRKSRGAESSSSSSSTHSSLPSSCCSVQEALERAYQADVEGQAERAVKLYATGLEAIQEALKLPVAGTGGCVRVWVGFTPVALCPLPGSCT